MPKTKKPPTAESLWRDYQTGVREANAACAKRMKMLSERYRRGMDKLEKAAMVKAAPKRKGKANVPGARS